MEAGAAMKTSKGINDGVSHYSSSLNWVSLEVFSFAHCYHYTLNVVVSV